MQESGVYQEQAGERETELGGTHRRGVNRRCPPPVRLSRIVHSLDDLIMLRGVGSFKFRNSQQNRAPEFCHRTAILGHRGDPGSI